MCGSTAFMNRMRSHPSFTFRKIRLSRSRMVTPRVSEPSVVEGSSPRRILSADSALRRDGQAPAPWHGAPDRCRAHGDPLSARGVGGPAPTGRPIPTIRRTGPPDRDALQRPRPRVVQAVLLQEVPRIPPAECDGESPHRARPSGVDLHLVRDRATKYV